MIRRFASHLNQPHIGIKVMSKYTISVERTPDISEEAKELINANVSPDLQNNEISLFDLHSIIDRFEESSFDLPADDLAVIEALLEDGISHIEN